MLHNIQKPVICFALQIKRLVSILNTVLDWNGLSCWIECGGFAVLGSSFIITGISDVSWDQFATGRLDWILLINPYAYFYHFKWKCKFTQLRLYFSYLRQSEPCTVKPYTFNFNHRYLSCKNIRCVFRVLSTIFLRKQLTRFRQVANILLFSQKSCTSTTYASIDATLRLYRAKNIFHNSQWPATVFANSDITWLLILLNALSVIMLKERTNIKTEVARKQSTPDFSKKKHFLPPDMHTYMCVSGGKKHSLFENLAHFVFLLPPFWENCRGYLEAC